jgi:hypothetical protein
MWDYWMGRDGGFLGVVVPMGKKLAAYENDL